MINYFILNPVSGKKKADNSILKDIRDISKELGLESHVYFTKSKGDGERYIRELCGEYKEKDEKLRIFGIGGDGTVNEMVNGAAGYDNVEVGIIPMGTGNDYIRNFGDAEKFRNIRGQLLGESVYSDLIRYRKTYMDETEERYCANMVNIGFDCSVVAMTDKVKGKFSLNGSLAYLVSVFITLGKKKETELVIEYGDGSVRDGRVLLASVANGCFCGGGIKGVPKCVLDDGLMDVSVVREGITRSRFVSLFPKYSKGTHLEDKRAQKLNIVDYRQVPELSVTAKSEEGEMFCVDGEVAPFNSVRFSMVKKAFKFIVPVDVK